MYMRGLWYMFGWRRSHLGAPPWTAWTSCRVWQSLAESRMSRIWSGWKMLKGCEGNGHGSHGRVRRVWRLKHRPLSLRLTHLTIYWFIDAAALEETCLQQWLPMSFAWNKCAVSCCFMLFHVSSHCLTSRLTSCCISLFLQLVLLSTWLLDEDHLTSGCMAVSSEAQLFRSTCDAKVWNFLYHRVP